ncbi:MAG TPA: DNA polymerase III subunit delta [Thermoanaerobaculia bacterium]|nr:DNA polymerase III subunit delta [Thermoanaerobaculia bacterium]
MAIAVERALRKSMRERAFERVYYFRGDDDFLKESTARELIAAVLDPATRDFNFELIRGDETTAEAVDTVLSTPPMLAARRMVVIRDVQELRKDARAALDRYLARPAADLVLLLIEPAGEKVDGSLAGSSFVVDFEPLSDDRVPAWIAHHAGTSLGASISESAARLLHEAVGADLSALASELDKLASYAAGGAIDDDAVRAVVGVRSGETLADLLDAVADRDAARAVPLVPVVLSQAKANVVTVIMALATQMCAIAWGRAARDRNIPPPGIERGFYALLKEGKAFPGRAWKDAVAAWSRGIQRWTSAQLEHAMNELLAADVAAKEARVSSEEQLLTSLVLALCAHNERKVA